MKEIPRKQDMLFGLEIHDITPERKKISKQIQRKIFKIKFKKREVLKKISKQIQRKIFKIKLKKREEKRNEEFKSKIKKKTVSWLEQLDRIEIVYKKSNLNFGGCQT